MEMGSRTTVKCDLSLEERMFGVVEDSANLLYNLTRVGVKQSTDEPIEIWTDLPARLDGEVILAYLNRWDEVQKHFGKDLRIYAWSVNPIVEKYMLGCLQNMSHIFLTVLPYYLKEKKTYGF